MNLNHIQKIAIYFLFTLILTSTFTYTIPVGEADGEPPIFYKFLLIIPDDPEWMEALKPFLDWKIREGGYFSSDLPENCLPIKVVNLTEIEATYGSANASSIRSYIIDFWRQNRYTLTTSTLKYVLLIGDVRFIPTYLYNVSINGKLYTYAADQYYADFYYPQADCYINPAENFTDWEPEVYVGRFPVNNAEELRIIVNKTITYEMHLNKVYENFPAGWERNVLFLGAVMDNGYLSSGYQVWKDGAFIAEAIKRQCKNLWSGAGPLSILRETTLYDSNNNISIWLPNYQNLNNIHNLTAQDVVNQINSVGFSGVFVVSHGTVTHVQGRKPSQKNAYAWQAPFFSVTNVSSLNNSYILPFWFIEACDTGAFQYDLWRPNIKSLGETLLLADPSEDGGAVAFIGCSNSSWYRFYYYPAPQNKLGCLSTLSDRLANLTFYQLYSKGALIDYSPNKWSLSSALFEAKRVYNATSWGMNAKDSMHMATLMGFNLLGDPTLHVWSEVPLNTPDFYSVEVPSSVKPGENFTVKVTVNVMLSGGSYPPLGPRKGAKVCVSCIENGKLTYFDLKLTDENGTATFTAPDHACTLNVTVIDHPYMAPWLGEIEVEDIHPPFIGTPLRFPPDENVPEFQDVKIAVNVTDYESGVENVTLYYTTDSEWTPVEMTLNESSGLYEAIIKGQKAGTHVKYKIEAFDKAGNRAVQDNNQEYFVYLVIPEKIWQPAIIALATIVSITYMLLKTERKEFKLPNG